MKRFRLIERLLPVVTALTLSACSLDELGGTGGSTDVQTKMGSLVIEALTVNIDNEYIDLGSNNTITRTGETAGDATTSDKKFWPVPNPNEVVEDIGSYWIEIFKKGETTPIDINGAESGTGLSFSDVQTLNSKAISTENGENVNTQTSTSEQLKGIALEPGEYVVWAYKTDNPDEDIEDVAVDNLITDSSAEKTTPAYYMGYMPITIEAGQQTTIAATNPIVCKLAQVLVTVQLSADMLKWFDENNDCNTTGGSVLATTVTLSGGEGEPRPSGSYTFPYNSKHGELVTTTTTADDKTTETTKVVDGGPYVYFKNFAGTSSTDGNTLDISMKGVYLNVKPGVLDQYINNDGTIKDEGKQYLKPIEWKQSLSKVMAGQWRQISIDIDHNNTGQVTFNVTVSDFVFDEEIDVRVDTFNTTLSVEDRVADIHDDAPSVELVDDTSGETMTTTTYNISDDKYSSTSGSWTDFLNVKVSPEPNATIKEVYAVVKSVADEDSDKDLGDDLEEAGFANGRVPLYQGGASTAAATDISKYLTINPNEDGSIVFALNNAGMSAMSQYKGTHTVTVWTEDDQYRKKPTTLTITVTSEGQSSGGSGGTGGIVNGLGVVWTDQDITIETGEEKVSVTITAEKGMAGLTVNIDSDVLDAGELGTVGLSPQMNLFKPASYREESNLRALGFLPYDPDNGNEDPAFGYDEYRVYNEDGTEIINESPLYGLTSKTFDISQFMGMLGMLGTSTNTFTITVTDTEGNSCSSSAIIRIP